MKSKGKGKDREKDARNETGKGAPSMGAAAMRGKFPPRHKGKGKK